MLRLAIQHDLDAMCHQCLTDVKQLSEYSGISETRLRAFAAGELPLSARDRLSLVSLLHWFSERFWFAHHHDPEMLAIARRPRWYEYNKFTGFGGAALAQIEREAEEEARAEVQ